eukprot:6210618-Pleurochrysis_carterae.AAC.8
MPQSLPCRERARAQPREARWPVLHRRFSLSADSVTHWIALARAAKPAANSYLGGLGSCFSPFLLLFPSTSGLKVPPCRKVALYL